jgi:hypothetical protein
MQLPILKSKGLATQVPIGPSMINFKWEKKKVETLNPSILGLGKEAVKKLSFQEK